VGYPYGGGVLYGREIVPMVEVTPPAEVMVERVDEVVNEGLVEALELALREVNSPEFAEVVLARLEAVGV
jgi:hypothetical protein